MNVRKCKHCGARCENKWRFKKHMALHDKVKGEYYCEVDGCGKTFTHASYLKHHMVTHNDKPTLFTCPSKDCIEKKRGIYKNRSNLVRHLQLHKGVEFKCEMCDKIFWTRRNLHNHKSRVHIPVLECRYKEKYGCKYNTKDRKLILKHEQMCKKNRDSQAVV